jgi:hypothetical protein
MSDEHIDYAADEALLIDTVNELRFHLSNAVILFNTFEEYSALADKILAAAAIIKELDDRNGERS